MRLLAIGAVSLLLAAGCGGEDHGGHGAADGPPAPSMLAAMPLPPGVHVTWKDNSTDEDGFDVMRKEGGGSFATIMSVPANITMFHDSTAAAGKTYTYMAHSKKAGKLSLPSNEVTVAVP